MKSPPRIITPLQIITPNITKTGVSIAETKENVYKKLPETKETQTGDDLSPPNKIAKIDDNKIPKKLYCSIDSMPPIESLHSANIEDWSAKKLVEKITQKETFREDLVAKFSRIYSTEIDSIKIEKLQGSKGVNADSHFIITHGEKKYHAKPALHGNGISLGSKFNEITFYKLNEILKIGPRCDGIVSDDGVLMIVTEDLSSRTVGNAQNKTISFADNEKSKGVKKDVIEAIPSRHRDNVHRCATEIVINLLFYADVQANYGNTGFKITKKIIDGDSQEIKEKPFIIDFRLSTNEDLHLKYNEFLTNQSDEIKKYAEIIGSHLDSGSAKEEIPVDIFKFKQDDPQIIKDALKKLFLTEDGNLSKFDEAILNAFDYSTLLAKNSGMSDRDLSDNITSIEIQKQKTILHVKAFLENPKIHNFLEEEGRKIKAEKTLTASSASLSASGSEGGSASTSPRDLESVINISDTKEGVSKSIAV